MGWLANNLPTLPDKTFVDLTKNTGDRLLLWMTCCMAAEGRIFNQVNFLQKINTSNACELLKCTLEAFNHIFLMLASIHCYYMVLLVK